MVRALIILAIKMPAPLHVKLTPEEDTTLRELSLAPEVPRRTRQRAITIRLNSSGGG